MSPITPIVWAALSERGLPRHAAVPPLSTVDRIAGHVAGGSPPTTATSNPTPPIACFPARCRFGTTTPTMTIPDHQPHQALTAIPEDWDDFSIRDDPVSEASAATTAGLQILLSDDDTKETPAVMPANEDAAAQGDRDPSLPPMAGWCSFCGASMRGSHHICPEPTCNMTSHPFCCRGLTYNDEEETTSLPVPCRLHWNGGGSFSSENPGCSSSAAAPRGLISVATSATLLGTRKRGRSSEAPGKDLTNVDFKWKHGKSAKEASMIAPLPLSSSPVIGTPCRPPAKSVPIALSVFHEDEHSSDEESLRKGKNLLDKEILDPTQLSVSDKSNVEEYERSRIPTLDLPDFDDPAEVFQVDDLPYVVRLEDQDRPDVDVVGDEKADDTVPERLEGKKVEMGMGKGKEPVRSLDKRQPQKERAVLPSDEGGDMTEAEMVDDKDEYEPEGEFLGGCDEGPSPYQEDSGPERRHG
ncbi:hypothetical protein HK101_003413, partial [Irineochytrium annulatum]